MQPHVFRQRLLELAAEYEVRLQEQHLPPVLRVSARPVPPNEGLHAAAAPSPAGGSGAGPAPPRGVSAAAGSACGPSASPAEQAKGVKDCESASPGGDGERDRQRGSQASSQRAAAAGALRPSTRSSRTSAGTDGGTEAEPSASWRLRSKFDGLVRKSSRDLRASVPEPERCSLASWVNSSYFTVTIACVVIASTLTIGIEAQLLSSLSREGSSSEKVLIAMATTNYVITFLFMLEMAARIYVYRLDFFVHERMWNCFDLIVLLCALSEVALELIVQSIAGKRLELFENGGTAKILRLFRLTRLLRLVRTFRQLKPLRMLVHSIVFAGRTVFWALVLLLMIVYAFGVVLTLAVMEHTDGGKRIDDEALIAYYGDLYRSMLSLWMAVSGGISWIEVALPLQRIGSPVWMVVFLLYVIFVYVFVLNVVTGVFCQSAFEGAQQDLDLTIEAQLKEKQTYVDRLKMLFQEMHCDPNYQSESSGLTAAELHAQLARPKVKAWFKAVDVDAKQTWKLFKILDGQNSGQIDLEQFVEGCLRLRGPATCVDVESLKWEIRMVSKRADQIAEKLALN